MNKQLKKLELTIIGIFFSMLNILLIESRFNLVGLGFGFISLFFLIKALLIKKEDK